MTATPVLVIEAARGADDRLPHVPLDLVVPEGSFCLIETPGPRRAAAFANLCAGLTPLLNGRVQFLGRDWQTVSGGYADALRGHIGRLFYQPLRPDIQDVAARILLARLHHSRVPEAALRTEAAMLALRFGLPGLPAGPARYVADRDLLRAACVRAFLGTPRLVILELPMAAQQDDLLDALLQAGAEARARGAAVLWLAAAGPAIRHRAILPTIRLRLGEAGLTAARPLTRAA